MPNMRSLLILIVLVMCSASFGVEPAPKAAMDPADTDPYAFMEHYRIEYYLELAVDLQKLNPTQRAERLKVLATDPKRASEVYPLCRMLFEAKPKGEFRCPMIGGADFIDGGGYAGWPLVPITIIENIPILVVSGYFLAGQAERPEFYVDCCLRDCKWRDTKYEVVPLSKRKAIVEKFIAVNPKLKDKADWLREQAE